LVFLYYRHLPHTAGHGYKPWVFVTVAQLHLQRRAPPVYRLAHTAYLPIAVDAWPLYPGTPPHASYNTLHHAGQPATIQANWMFWIHGTHGCYYDDDATLP